MENMEAIQNIDPRFRIFGGLFLLSTRLETIGNSEAYLGELTTKQWFLLLNLSAFFTEPPTVGQLARQMGTSHQNAKTLALHLQGKGFVDIVKDKKDGRSLRILLLPKGQTYLEEDQTENDRFVEDLMGILSPEEITLMNRCIFKLAEQADFLRKKSEAGKPSTDDRTP